MPKPTLHSSSLIELKAIAAHARSLANDDFLYENESFLQIADVLDDIIRGEDPAYIAPENGGVFKYLSGS